MIDRKELNSIIREMKQHGKMLKKEKEDFFNKYFKDIDNIDNCYLIIPKKHEYLLANDILPNWVVFDRNANNIYAYKGGF